MYSTCVCLQASAELTCSRSQNNISGISTNGCIFVKRNYEKRKRRRYKFCMEGLMMRTEIQPKRPYAVNCTEIIRSAWGMRYHGLTCIIESRHVWVIIIDRNRHLLPHLQGKIWNGLLSFDLRFNNPCSHITPPPPFSISWKLKESDLQYELKIIFSHQIKSTHWL